MTFPRTKMSLLLALPVVAVAALMLAAPLRAQAPPAKADQSGQTDQDARKAGAAESSNAPAADQRSVQDAERRKPKRDGDRKPLPQREREEEDDRR